MRNCFKKGKMFRFRVPRGDNLILAPPPEYAASGGWALAPKGSPRALPKARQDPWSKPGMTVVEDGSWLQR